MIRYYWDSCVFISRLQGVKNRIAVLENITDRAAKDEIRIVTSSLTVAEVCYIDREYSVEQKLKDIDKIARFFDNDYIQIVQVTRHLANEAAKIGVKHGVKPPDAIHLATAIHADCQIVHTYDGSKLLRLNQLVGEPPLTIIEPVIEVQPMLFGDDEISDEPEEPEPARINADRIRQLIPITHCGGWNVPSSRVWGRSLSPFSRTR